MIDIATKAQRHKEQIWTPTEREAWKLPEKIMVSECADKIRILPPDCAEPGPYRTSRTPYMRGPMDSFSDPEVEESDWMFPRQFGKSCGVQNVVAYTIDQDPADTKYIVPREKDVDYVTEKVFKPMIELSPTLLRHTSGSPRDLQGTHFDFDRMTLYFGWAGSPAELKQKHIKNLIFDELTVYPPFAGKEANPVDMAIKTTTTFWDRKIIRVSTPSTAGDYIDGPYKESNMGKYYIPCPRCGEYSLWKWINFRKPEKLTDPAKIIEEGIGCIWYLCEFCHHKIEEIQKELLVAAGVWLPKGQTIDADSNIHGEPERSKRHSGFNAPAWIAPFEGVSWPRIMARWLHANTEEGRALGELVSFHNEIEGVPHEEAGRKLKTSELRKLVGGFAKGTVPADCELLVAAADYHKSRTRGIIRIDYAVKGFAPGLKNYTITSGHATSFDELDKAVLLSAFPWADGTPSEKKMWLPVVCLFVDSGFQKFEESQPDDVYEYCRLRPGLTIPTKGLPGPLAKMLSPSDLESATERRLNARQRARYRGMQLILVDTYFFKDQVQNWAEAKYDEQGKMVAEPLMRFYDGVPFYYLTEFSNEYKVKVRDKKGVRWIWQPVTPGAQTHSLDLEVLCAAAGYYKGVYALKGAGEKVLTAAAAGMRRKISLSELQRQKRLR